MKKRGIHNEVRGHPALFLACVVNNTPSKTKDTKRHSEDKKKQQYEEKPKKSLFVCFSLTFCPRDIDRYHKSFLRRKDVKKEREEKDKKKTRSDALPTERSKKVSKYY